jgi:tetratricopeptide (TPR) repeat protein
MGGAFVTWRPALLLAAAAVSACRQPSATPEAAPTYSDAVREGKALLESGQLDAALAKLQESPAEPDSLYYQGVVWAKKAQSAPLPTPPPPPSPLPKGWEPPPGPGFKPEEVQAAQFLEQAIALKPDHAPAHLALAELLGPHAARQQEQARQEEERAAKKGGARRGSPAPALPPPTSPVDASVDRVIRSYQMAVQGDPGLEVLESMIGFGARVGRLDAQETAFQELVRRVRERAEPLVRYGDFLVNQKKDPEAAIEQYRQALIWKTDDDATRGKIADIYLTMVAAHYAQQQYALAEARLRDAQKWVTDRDSPQGRRLEDYQARLRDIRRPAGR